MNNSFTLFLNPLGAVGVLCTAFGTCLTRVFARFFGAGAFLAVIYGFFSIFAVYSRYFKS